MKNNIQIVAAIEGHAREGDDGFAGQGQGEKGVFFANEHVHPLKNAEFISISMLIVLMQRRLRDDPEISTTLAGGLAGAHCPRPRLPAVLQTKTLT